MEIKLLSCPLCSKPHFEGVDSLRSSLISVATSHLKCPVCNESLLGLDKLTIHLFTHITETNNQNNNASPNIKPDKEIDDSINSINMVEAENAERVKCDICSFTFTDRTILDMHQKLLHQTIPDKSTGLYNYHCHLCSKKFKKRGSLMVHLRVAHYGFGHDTATDDSTYIAKAADPVKVQDNKQWECDVCSKMFTTKYFLKKHKRLHTGEMPYFCGQCNKSFTFQQSYHKHMLYHSSEKPYVCTECGRAFKELSTLQNHVRIHSGERPFGCETCGKRFRQRVSYLVHQRIHTGVMPYKCTACDKSFRYKVSQRSHKCPVNPPGSVIRIVENGNGESKCIMSVDYNTGSINFIPSTNAVTDDKVLNNPLATLETTSCNEDILKKKIMDNGESQIIHENAIFPAEPPDLFSMVLSPLLPDVESLCLTSPSMETLNKSEESPRTTDLQIITEESLKEMLYGSQNN